MKRLVILPVVTLLLLCGLYFWPHEQPAMKKESEQAKKAEVAPPTSNFSFLPAARADDKEDSELGLAGDVKVDEFNEDGKGGKPVRGGMIRIRIPADPKSLNFVIDTDATTQEMCGYTYDSLAAKQFETFELLPQIARFWKTRDLVFLKDGRKLEGRVVSEDDKGIVFAEGASKWTIAKHELEPFAETDAKVTWKKGFGEGSIEGKLSHWPGGKYTVYVEEKPAKTIEIKSSEIATVDEETDGKKTSVPGVLKETVYEFTVRKGVNWDDGQPCTIDDILFTYNTIMNDKVLAAPLKADYGDSNFHTDPKKACVKVSDDVVRFELRKQYFRGLTIAASVPILPAHRYDVEKFKGDPDGFAKNFNNHPDNSKPVGNGRYKVSAWERGKYVELVRNDDWWAAKANLPWISPGAPFLDKIQWIIINNPNAALRAMTNGEVDADFEIEQLQWKDPETNKAEFTKQFVRAQYTSPIFTYIGWNQKRPDVDEKHRFFTDPRVRMAMTMLIDRKKILDEIHFGLGVMVTGPFFEKGPFCDRRIKPVEYNPEKAKALLDQAGWVDHDGDGIRDKDGVPFEFEYRIHTAKEYHKKIAEIVKQDIEKAGIKVTIKATEFTSFQSFVDGRKFDAVRFASSDPDCTESDPYSMWHSSQWEGNGQNACGYSNPEVDDICVRARRELNFKKRQALFRKMHRILNEDQPFTFLFNLYELYFYNKKFRNVKFYVLGTTPRELDEWYIPKELQKDLK